MLTQSHPYPHAPEAQRTLGATLHRLWTHSVALEHGDDLHRLLLEMILPATYPAPANASMMRALS